MSCTRFSYSCLGYLTPANKLERLECGVLARATLANITLISSHVQQSRLNGKGTRFKGEYRNLQ